MQFYKRFLNDFQDSSLTMSSHAKRLMKIGIIVSKIAPNKLRKIFKQSLSKMNLVQFIRKFMNGGFYFFDSFF